MSERKLGMPGRGKWRLGNPIHVSNPRDRDWKRNRYLFGFGCVGTTFVLVYANGIEDGLEEAAAYCVEQGWFGHVTPHDRPLPDLGCDCTDPFECESHTYTESGWLTSYEWTVDEVTNADLRAIHAR